MSFTIAAVATSIASLLLGLGWLFAGALMLKRWELEAEPPGLVVGRRLGAAYCGIAILLFLGRLAPPSYPASECGNDLIALACSEA